MFSTIPFWLAISRNTQRATCVRSANSWSLGHLRNTRNDDRRWVSTTRGIDRLEILTFKVFVLALLFVLATSVYAERSTEHLIVARGADVIASFEVEIASDIESRRVGLMWRSGLAAQKGMLFDFGQQQAIYMWMKNTLMPLDMLFITEDFEIVFIKHKAQPHALKLVSAATAVRYVLELNAGVANAFGIVVGDKIDWIGNRGSSGLQDH